MKVFSTKFHGFLDYLMGVILLAMPALLDLDTANTESQIFFGVGGILLLYSLMTKYELGLIRVISMKIHLALDVLSGLFLASAPWIFGFGERLFIPYLILGVAVIIAGLTTTSKRGQPEMQEIIATETIMPEIIRESSMNTPRTKRSATTKPAKAAVGDIKTPKAKHSITETKKAAESKARAMVKPAKAEQPNTKKTASAATSKPAATATRAKGELSEAKKSTATGKKKAVTKK